MWYLIMVNNREVPFEIANMIEPIEKKDIIEYLEGQYECFGKWYVNVNDDRIINLDMIVSIEKK